MPKNEFYILRSIFFACTVKDLRQEMCFQSLTFFVKSLLRVNFELFEFNKDVSGALICWNFSKILYGLGDTVGFALKTGEKRAKNALLEKNSKSFFLIF